MSKFACIKCGTKFADNAHLKRHLARKTPCEPIVDQDPKKSSTSCRYCGRQFASKTSMYRHVRQNCKIANTEDGMDKLLEHTLQRQNRELKTEVAEVKAQVSRLTELLEKQLLTPLPAGAVGTAVGQQVNMGQVNQVNAVTTQVINIVPWDGADRLRVGLGEIAAAFAENARLKEYAGYDSHEKASAEIAPPYVTELFMDLVKRGHADPAARNVYLNPRRADQVLVNMASGKWEVRALAEATRLLFDGVAKTIHNLNMTIAETMALPLDAQDALAMAGLVYKEEPDMYVERARGQMSAHLTNMAPTQKS